MNKEKSLSVVRIYMDEIKEYISQESKREFLKLVAIDIKNNFNVKEAVVDNNNGIEILMDNKLSKPNMLVDLEKIRTYVEVFYKIKFGKNNGFIEPTVIK